MNIRHWLDSSCEIQRTSTEKDAHNHPKQAKKIIGRYPCRVGRTTGTYTQGTPQGIAGSKPRIYTVPDADIQAGDLIVVNGVDKYIVDYPYKPGGDHTECDAHRIDEP